jgi:hypothetical protein
MSILKPRGLTRNGRPAEIEGSIRELVRRESSGIRQGGDSSEQAARELASLVQRISCSSTRDVDHLIVGLTNVRQKLDDEAKRIQYDIMQYASLTQSVMQLTKIVSDGMTHVANATDSRGFAGETPAVPNAAPVVPEQLTDAAGAEPSAC